MGEQKETFVVESVQKHLDVINDLFEKVATLLKESNDRVFEVIQTGPTSAMFGNLASQLLSIWDQNASTFGDFKLNFEEWSKMISIITANNLQFEEETIDLYKNTGKNLSGIQEKREELMSSSAKTTGDSTRGGTTSEYYDENGNLVVIETDEDGNQYKKTVTDKDGNIVNIYYDGQGNYSETKLVDGKSVTKFYDENGNEIERPYTFSPSGISYSEEGIKNVTTREANQFMTDHGLDTSSAEYANLSPEAKAIVDETLQKVEDLGLPDGSVEWQEKFNSLPPETQDIVLASVRGNVSQDIPKTNSYTISSEVPTGEYDGRTIVVPKLNESDFSGSNAGSVRKENAQIIIDSAGAVQETLRGENTALTSLKGNLENNATYNALPAESREAINQYLDSQIAQRSSLDTQITDDCKRPWNADDGAIGDAVSWSLSDSGYTNKDYGNYKEAADAANAWNATLSEIDSLNEVTAMLNSYGVFIN